MHILVAASILVLGGVGTAANTVNVKWNGLGSSGTNLPLRARSEQLTPRNGIRQVDSSKGSIRGDGVPSLIQTRDAGNSDAKAQKAPLAKSSKTFKPKSTKERIGGEDSSAVPTDGDENIVSQDWSVMATEPSHILNDAADTSDGSTVGRPANSPENGSNHSNSANAQPGANVTKRDESNVGVSFSNLSPHDFDTNNVGAGLVENLGPTLDGVETTISNTPTTGPSKILRPVTNDDFAKTTKGSSVVLSVLSNDAVPRGAGGNFDDPSHGAIELKGAEFVYTPDPDFCGIDTFLYTVSAGEHRDTATVYIDVVCDIASEGAKPSPSPSSAEEGDASELMEEVSESNGRPTDNSGALTTYSATGKESIEQSPSDISMNSQILLLQDDYVEGDMNEEIIIPVLANDVYDPSKSQGEFDPPRHGKITHPIRDGVVYVPNAEYCGFDSFTYEIRSGEMLDKANVTIFIRCDASNVTIEMAPINAISLKTINDYAEGNMNEELIIPALTNDIFPENAQGSFNHPHHGEIIKPTESGLLYLPDAGFCGLDHFSYNITSGEATDTANVTIRILCNAPNQVKAAQDGDGKGESNASAIVGVGVAAGAAIALTVLSAIMIKRDNVAENSADQNEEGDRSKPSLVTNVSADGAETMESKNVFHSAASTETSSLTNQLSHEAENTANSREIQVGPGRKLSVTTLLAEDTSTAEALWGKVPSLRDRRTSLASIYRTSPSNSLSSVSDSSASKNNDADNVSLLSIQAGSMEQASRGDMPSLRAGSSSSLTVHQTSPSKCGFDFQ